MFGILTFIKQVYTTYERFKEKQIYVFQYFSFYEQLKVYAHLTVILLPAHPASFARNIVPGIQRFYFSESQDVIVLHTCH